MQPGQSLGAALPALDRVILLVADLHQAAGVDERDAILLLARQLAVGVGDGLQEGLAFRLHAVGGTRGATVSKTIGPGLSGNSPIQNAKSTKLGPGDIQIIPPGVAHGFTSIDAGGIEYLVFRVDPDHLLALPQ